MNKKEKTSDSKKDQPETKVEPEVKKDDTKKKTKDKDDPKKPKDPYEKMTVTDIQKKIDEMSFLISEEKRTRDLLIESKKEELANREKVIISVGAQNKAYINELEKLKQEVDKQLNTIGVRDIQNQIAASSKKITPHEKTMELKEKELENVNKLIDIFKKEHKSILKYIEVGTYERITVLKEKLSKLKKNNETLELQIRNNNKKIEEYSFANAKPEKARLSQILEVDIRVLKTKLMNLDEETKDNEKMIEKLENDKKSAVIEITELKSKLPELRVSKNRIASERALTPTKIKEKQKLELSKSLDQVNRFRFLSMNTNELATERPSLMSAPEYNLLKDKIGEEKLKQFESKFNSVSSQKTLQEKKHLDETKQLNKKLYENEEKLEYLLLQLKEHEQKNKLLNFQINEFKSESKLMLKKKNEITQSITKLEKLYSEKVFENNLLQNEMAELKKKHQENVEQALKEKEKKSQEQPDEAEENQEEKEEEPQEEEED